MLNISLDKETMIFVERGGETLVIKACRKKGSGVEVVVSISADRDSFRIYRTGAHCTWPKDVETFFNTPTKN
jgi:hypothetical protein